MECCLIGSSIGAGIINDEWFAATIQEVTGSVAEGWLLGCILLGCERDSVFAELASAMAEGYVHLCPGEPCLHEDVGPVIHVTRVRFWRLQEFDADYLSDPGKAHLRKMIQQEKKMFAPPPKPATEAAKRRAPATTDRGRGRGRRPAGAKAEPADRSGSPLISLLSEDDGEEPDVAVASADKVRRGALRSTLRKTRERILGQGRGEGRPTPGPAAGNTARAVARSALVAGTNLNPGHKTPLRLGALEDSSVDTMRSLKKRLSGAGAASSALVTQALEQSVRESKNQKKRKTEKSRKDGVRQLVALLQGKKTKKKKSWSDKSKEKVRFKKDPDGSGGSSSSGYSTDSDYSGKEDSENSDLDCKPPLRKRAARDPGSVMEMPSQLELYPLEPVQSATTATMLEAQKHRKLVLKSQGLGGVWQSLVVRCWPGKRKLQREGEEGRPQRPLKRQGQGPNKRPRLDRKGGEQPLA